MKVLVNGQLIEYKDEGKGTVVLLLHGWGSNLHTFDALATDLKKHHRVIRFDFSGMGASPKPDDSWGVSEYAQLTADFLKKLNVETVDVLVGHSFGGRVIIKGFADSVLTANKVILLGAAGPRSKETAKRIIFKALAKAGRVATSLPGIKKAQPALRRTLYGAAGATDYLDAGTMQKIFINTVNEDLGPFVSAITVPTLMIWGENDDQVPVRVAESMQKMIAQSQLIVVPGAGHFVHEDDYSAVQKEIEAFLG